jgi:hypothetical protein
MVKRLLTWVMVFSFALTVMALGSRAAEEAEGEGPSLREAVWQTALRTLQDRGFVMQWSSFEEGRMITEFMPLERDTLLASVALPEQEQERQWSSAAYRYEVGIGKKGEGMRIFVQAEIHAWTSASQEALLQPEEKQVLSSNYALEREFLAAFKTVLGQGTAE